MMMMMMMETLFPVYGNRFQVFPRKKFFLSKMILLRGFNQEDYTS